jgi:hypothetical protein
VTLKRRLIQDLADIRAVVDAGATRIDWEYITCWISPDESTWLKAVARSSDEELVRRFFGPERI